MREVAPCGFVAGGPARQIRMRFGPDRIAAIEASRWRERELADPARNPPFEAISGEPLAAPVQSGWSAPARPVPSLATGRPAWSKG